MVITQLQYLVKPRLSNLRKRRLVLCFWAWCGVCVLACGQQLERFAFDHRQMGTQFRIILYAPDSVKAKTAAEDAFVEIDRLNDIFSDYDEKSELSRLTAFAGKGEGVSISEEMWILVCQAQRISRKSKGAFDITIGPLSKLWRRAFRQQVFPKMEQILAAKQLVDYRQLVINPGQPRLRLNMAGMRLDAGGIAKGFALDRAMIVLKSHGILHALVDGGGDILVSKAPPGQAGWRFQTSTVDANQQLREVHLLFENCAVATSGDTYRYLEWNGKRYSHIIDPRTGLGVSHGALVSVQAPNGMLADALASALSILGPKKGKRLIKKFKNCYAQLILQSEESSIQYGQLNSIK